MGHSARRSTDRFLVKLFAHVNRDDDILEAWVRHYLALGVTSLHVVMHGPQDQNRTLLALKGRYPITIEHAYTGEYRDENQAHHLTNLVRQHPGEWVFVVDSDEFVELPCESMEATIQVLERAGADALRAPLLQRIAADGSLPPCRPGEDPNDCYPLCSCWLYTHLGQPEANRQKFPLFFVTKDTRVHVGNHAAPNRPARKSWLLGVTHHYKWRAIVRRRLAERAESGNTFRRESAGYRAAIEARGGRLPLTDTFPYSREALLRRGLLRSDTLKNRLRYRVARGLARLPRASRPNRGER